MARIEIIRSRVIIGWSCDHHKIGIGIRFCAIERRRKIKILLRQILLDIIILNRRDPTVDLLHFLRYHVHCHHIIVLCKKSRNTQPHITGACYCYVIFFHRWIKVCNSP